MSRGQSMICDLPQSTFKSLCDSLDLNSAWRTLVSTLSNTPFSLKDTEREECSQELYKDLYGSPSKRLLQKLDMRGLSVEGLCGYLDEAGLQRSLQFIKPYEALQITEEPAERVEVMEGCRLTLKCASAGFPRPLYVWFRGDEEVVVGGGGGEGGGEGSGRLVINVALKRHAGVYTCRVQHYVGGDGKEGGKGGGWRWLLSSSCDVIVKHCNNFREAQPIHHPQPPSSIPFLNQPNPEPPQLLLQPTSQTNSLGGVVNFRVKAQHPFLPLSYQWFHNNTPILGATDSDYRIEDVSRSNAGRYQVSVFSEHYRCVQVVSNVATLTIINKPNQFYANDKVALLLGNSSYRSYGRNLPAVKEDMLQTAAVLEMMGFKVVSLLDLTLREMGKAVEMFCEGLVGEGVYVLFYLIGHGFLHDHHHYLIPWDASQGVELSESLCIETCIQHIQQHNPLLLIVLMDVCRKNVELSTTTTPPSHPPPVKSRPNQAIIYAASVGEQSYEVKSKHRPRGLFNKYLLDVFRKKNFSIGDLYSELKRELRECPFDLNDERSPQHCEMTLNLEEPGRSLWDPVKGTGGGVVKEFWRKIQTLPPPTTTIHLHNLGNLLVTFNKHLSNVVAIHTEFVAARFDEKSKVERFDEKSKVGRFDEMSVVVEVCRECVDGVLLPLEERRVVGGVKSEGVVGVARSERVVGVARSEGVVVARSNVQVFLLHNLQRLKSQMSVGFRVRVRRRKKKGVDGCGGVDGEVNGCNGGGDGEVKNGVDGGKVDGGDEMVFTTEVIDAGFPLISSLMNM